MPRPVEGSYPAYFQDYINQVQETDAITALHNQQPVIDQFFDAITEEQSAYAYAPGKWTLRELLQHIIDSERIFCYRSLCFARGESQSLPGFDENNYAARSNANLRSWKGLCEELKSVRNASLCLFENFTDEMLSASGLANNNPISVNAMGFILAGHLNHHKRIIEERYLPGI